MASPSVSIYSYRLAYSKQVTWSDVREDFADYVLLRLSDGAGHEGLAEATVKPTWSGNTVFSMVTALRELILPVLKRCDLREPAATWRQLSHLAEQAQAKGLAETALWSLLQQRDKASFLSRPLNVPVSFTLTRQSPKLMAEEATVMADRFGFCRFKLKGGQSKETDAEGVRTVLASLNSAVVQVDANSAYNADELPQYSAALREVGAVLLEDPCVFEPLGFSDQVGCSALPLLVDTAARDSSAARWYASAGAAAVSVKPGRYGIPQALKVATAARDQGAKVGLGLFGESDLGSAINLRLFAAWEQDACMLPAELTSHLALREHLLPNGMEPEGGWLSVPTFDQIIQQIDFTRMDCHDH